MSVLATPLEEAPKKATRPLDFLLDGGSTPPRRPSPIPEDEVIPDTPQPAKRKKSALTIKQTPEKLFDDEPGQSTATTPKVRRSFL